MARWETFPSEVTIGGRKFAARLLGWAAAVAIPVLVSGPVAAAEGAGARAVPCEGALPLASDLPVGGQHSKFALAEATCGRLPLGASPAPRVSPLLALYADRETQASQREPEDPAPLSAPAPVAKPQRAAPSGPAVQRILALVPKVAEVARRYGIDPLLLHAVAHVESRHRADARSHAGARGVLQVMPDTARRFGLDDPQRELLQPELNLQVGAEYLKTLQARFGNDLPLVLAAYNAGEGAVEKYGRRIPPYPETQAYVREVLATYAELRRRVLGVPAGSV